MAMRLANLGYDGNEIRMIHVVAGGGRHTSNLITGDCFGGWRSWTECQRGKQMTGRPLMKP